MLLALLACGPLRGPVPYVARTDAAGTVEVTLDVRTPDPAVWGEGPFPAIVLFHPGGWREDDLYSWDFEGRMIDAARRGWVGVTADYRLTDEEVDGRVRWPWPAQLDDARCAVRWVQAHAGSLRVDVDRIAAVGFSSGGHLALLLGLAGERPDTDPGCPWPGDARVAAVVSRAGPADLTTPWDDAPAIARRYVARLGGRTDRRAPAPDLLADASPVRWVGPPDVPVLQVQGGRDGIVRPEGTQRLHAALVASGVDARYEVLARSGHLFWLAGKRRAEAIEWAWLAGRLEEVP